MKSILKGLIAIMILLSVAVSSAQDKNQADELKSVFNSYFQLKEALVKSDGKAAALAASDLFRVIGTVPMDKMKSEQHTVWMKILPALKEEAEHISDTNDIKHQRDHFMTLSTNMHQVIQVFPSDETVYYQKCPMANNGKGANWLSKEKAIKNPYYGSAMLTCGSTIETLK